MSNATPMMFGLAGGLALSHLTPKARPAAPAHSPSLRNSAGGALVIHLDRRGLAFDGDVVEVDAAVRRAQAAGLALVTVSPDAPASTYAALLAGLRAAGVPTHVRTLVSAARNASASTTTDYTLLTYARGHKAGPTSRSFRAEEPVSWGEARDRLAAAGILDLTLAGKTGEPGGWMLSIDRAQFAAARAEPFPGRRRNAETSSAFTLVTYPQGVGGSRKSTSWFRTDAPMTWSSVRDQLAAAGIIDPTAIAPAQPGYWKLVTDARVFMPMRAKPLPGPTPGGRRDARRSSRYALDGGRVIAFDGQPAVRLERVDLGDGRHALSPHDTDQLCARIVRLLNRQGAR